MAKPLKELLEGTGWGCPTCGCEHWNESGPCCGTEMARRLRALDELERSSHSTTLMMRKDVRRILDGEAEK